MTYKKFCEELFQSWLNQNLENEEELSKLFQLDYSPEPYFHLVKSKNPLHILLTNPGSGMDFQNRDNFSSESTYENFEKVLHSIYLSESFKNNGGLNAYRRLRKAIEFAHHLGYNGVVNIETIPFHSVDLNKSKALKAIKNIPILKDYVAKLKEYLLDKPILIVSACRSDRSIDKSTIKNNQWLSYQANLIDFNLNDAVMKELTVKNGKVSSALFSDGNKYITLMMGTNNLPSIENI